MYVHLLEEKKTQLLFGQSNSNSDNSSNNSNSGSSSYVVILTVVVSNSSSSNCIWHRSIDSGLCPLSFCSERNRFPVASSTHRKHRGYEGRNSSRTGGFLVLWFMNIHDGHIVRSRSILPARMRIICIEIKKKKKKMKKRK